MQNKMNEVNAWNRDEGLPELEMGIGIHSGLSVVGNIGSIQKMKYGCIGETVNLAGRIESLTIGGQVLISSSVRDRITEHIRIGSKTDLHAQGLAVRYRCAGSYCHWIHSTETVRGSRFPA